MSSTAKDKSFCQVLASYKVKFEVNVAMLPHILVYGIQPNPKFTEVATVNLPEFSLPRTLKQLICQSFTPQELHIISSYIVKYRRTHDKATICRINVFTRIVFGRTPSG